MNVTPSTEGQVECHLRVIVLEIGDGNVEPTDGGDVDAGWRFFLLIDPEHERLIHTPICHDPDPASFNRIFGHPGKGG